MPQLNRLEGVQPGFVATAALKPQQKQQRNSRPLRSHGARVRSRPLPKRQKETAASRLQCRASSTDDAQSNNQQASAQTGGKDAEEQAADDEGAGEVDRLAPTDKLVNFRQGSELEPWLDQWDELKEASCNAYSRYDNDGPGAEPGTQSAQALADDQAGGLQSTEPEQKQPKEMQHEPEKQDSALDNEQERMQRSSTAQRPKNGTFGKQTWDDLWGRLSYRYYNWRQDTTSDLYVFLLLNVGLILIGALVKSGVVDNLDGIPEQVAFAPARFWNNIYDVFVVMLAQEFPDGDATVAQRLFSTGVAIVGLIFFALILALTEQVILEVVDNKVKRGSPIYEKDHVLVLGWGKNQIDQEMIWKLLSQLCLAYKNDGGRVIVVMTTREKLEMEATFRRVIPESKRLGTQFVFRQGSCLVPDDLRMVAAAEAGSTIIVSDSSRSPTEADAQAIRTAVLLDELDFPGYDVPDYRTGSIVVAVQGASAVGLLDYCCSSRVLVLPTAQLNARRIGRMVRHPVVGSIGQTLWNFSSRSQAFIQPIQGLQGKMFWELAPYFPDGIVFGIVNPYSKRVLVNPPQELRLSLGDELLVLRPTTYKSGKYSIQKTPAKMDLGDWSPASYVMQSADEQDTEASITRAHALSGMARTQEEMVELEASKKDRSYAPQNGTELSTAANTTSMSRDMTLLPIETSPRKARAEKVLILGWAQPSFMTMLLQELDHGPAALPKGSEVTLFNNRESPDVMGKTREKAQLNSLSVLHVKGDPLEKADLTERIDLTKFRCAIILCDEGWVDPDLDTSNGIQIEEEGDLLRLDSMLLLVQLNVRSLLEERGFPEINIICEKVAFEGVTRFEDRFRLPLGISFNMSAFSATIMSQVLYDPRVLLPYSHLGETDELCVQDISSFAELGEHLTFWQLQARVASVGQVLYGYYSIPAGVDTPIDIVMNPEGDKIRSAMRVWNEGDGRCKLVTMTPKSMQDATPTASVAASLSASADEVTLPPMETQVQLEQTQAREDENRAASKRQVQLKASTSSLDDTKAQWP
ncbi:hypothetical protein WJX74_007389 [Apatococcus lobatus]|uniref:RCK N-terminal domain-containing protein n=1 Tax=Apatococcus lobatus TaxID=904363 RepID=A0AAW1SC42_9CHLO